VLEVLASEIAVPLSIDTSKARVAELALARGASIINDVTALSGDSEMVRVVADSGAAVVLMHMLGTPRTMQTDPRYDDVAGEVLSFLADRINWCERHGIPRSRIAIDPGIGFGKTFEHNLELLRSLNRFANLGCTLLVGISRKGVLGTMTGRDVSDRVVASAVSSLAACVAGARVVRVHDVAAMVDAIKVWTRICGWGESS
jgi:dihydropteroate synthase